MIMSASPERRSRPALEYRTGKRQTVPEQSHGAPSSRMKRRSQGARRGARGGDASRSKPDRGDRSGLASIASLRPGRMQVAPDRDQVVVSRRHSDRTCPLRAPSFVEEKGRVG